MPHLVRLSSITGSSANVQFSNTGALARGRTTFVDDEHGHILAFHEHGADVGLIPTLLFLRARLLLANLYLAKAVNSKATDKRRPFENPSTDSNNSTTRFITIAFPAPDNPCIIDRNGSFLLFL